MQCQESRIKVELDLDMKHDSVLNDLDVKHDSRWVRMPETLDNTPLTTFSTEIDLKPSRSTSFREV